MVSQWRLNKSYFSQVTGTLFSILTDQQCHCLDGLYSTSYFQVLHSLYQSFVDFTKRYPVAFMTHSFFSSLARSRFLSFFSLSFNFTVVCWDSKVHNSTGSLFCWLSPGLIVWPILRDPFVSQNPREFCASHSAGQILGCAYTICSYGQN